MNLKFEDDTARLTEEIQSAGETTQRGTNGIDRMVERVHDLEYQLNLCRGMMEKNSILPFPFERAVVLLARERRYAEALEICRYIETYCARAEREWDGVSAKIWRSPKLEKCISRITMLSANLQKVG